MLLSRLSLQHINIRNLSASDRHPPLPGQVETGFNLSQAKVKPAY
jgi:hypothetical protein